MDESNMPKRCKNAFQEIEEGKKSCSGLRQITILNSHRLHRMVTIRDMQDGVVGTTAFAQQDLSVYVEGEGFPELDLESLESQKSEYIGSVSFDADILLSDLEKFKLFVVHDPYPDPNGNQHPNHVRIICTKNTGNTQPIAIKAMFHNRGS